MATGLLLVAAGTSAAHSESFGINLVLQVPVMCTVSAGTSAAGVATTPTAPGSFELGAIREYCPARQEPDRESGQSCNALEFLPVFQG